MTSVSHNELTADQLHVPYRWVQEGDPGAGSGHPGHFWLKLSTAEVKRRKNDDSGWDLISDQTAATAALIATHAAAGDPHTGYLKESEYTTAGELLVATGAGTFAPVDVTPTPSDGDVLTWHGASTPKVVFAAPAGGGSPVSMGAYGSRPAAGTTGAVYLPNDAPVICYDDGSAWHNIGIKDGIEWSLSTAPSTWRNQGGATLTDRSWGKVLYAPAVGSTSSTSLRIREKNAPSAPYTMIARFDRVQFNRQYQAMGLCLVDSSGGGVVEFEFGYNGLAVVRYNSVTSFNAVSFSVELPANPDLYLRIVDDNTNRKFSVSNNKQDWVQLFSESRTAFLTPDKIGFFLNNQTGFNIDMYGTLVHWEG